ncbi:helix-turn-helix transcriptional regulator [Aeromicrobium wangtongii]|uniref:WYL domain-containing protein n=1 Tax=Aeromicrobium wangtongii TaxID=2969247 RepID=A0ABY5M3P5_9ACTN|nr:WYL domain-containing protein [Aeromicrobium wangtongii]MCD9198052.1 WYL domain-containing protein [Aeromicrobium wangtongii]UUP12092.1 WYL domain-containing protein [Aeromicrobium wangtongii]
MAERKTERLMNLIFALLVSRQYLTKEQIRESIADYRESTPQAFERKFERDKEELREMGINVEMGSIDKYFNDEPGYRIRRDEAELPDLELTREEAAVIGLATQVWEHAGLASESTTALVKLKAIGVDVDTSVLRMAEPKLSTDEPSFDAMWDAVTRRVPVTFTYTRLGQEPMQRHLQPWGIVSWHDRWYVGGLDLDRGESRLFRLSRITGDVTPDGPAGSYEIPEGIDMKDVARELFPAPPQEAAVLRIRAGRGLGLRRLAEKITPVGDGVDEVEIRYSSRWELASEVASYGPDVVVISPPDVRDTVVQRLRAAVNGQLDPA